MIAAPTLIVALAMLLVGSHVIVQPQAYVGRGGGAIRHPRLVRGIGFVVAEAGGIAFLFILLGLLGPWFAGGA